MPGFSAFMELFTLPKETGAAAGAGAPAAPDSGVATDASTVPAVLGAAAGRTPWRPAAMGAAIAAIAAAMGLAKVLVDPGEPQWDNLFPVLLSCLAAGVLEELLFRGGALPLLIAVFRNDGNAGAAAATEAEAAGAPSSRQSDVSAAICKAIIAQAAIFALLHLSGTPPEALTWAVPVQALAKTVAAFAFGVCMAALYVRTRNLLVPVGIHVAYDLLSLFPAELIHGPAATYLTGNPAEAAIMVAEAVLLVVVTVMMLRPRGSK